MRRGHEAKPKSPDVKAVVANLPRGPAPASPLFGRKRR